MKKYWTFYSTMQEDFDVNELNLGYYGKFADDFEKIPFGSTIQQMLSVHTHEGKKVLDIGSGPGALGIFLEGEGYCVTCLEPSKEMATRCRQKGLKVIQNTLDGLEVDEEFDVVLAVSSLIHVPKVKVVDQVQKIYYLMNQTGIFIISMLLGEGEGLTDPLNRGHDRYFNYFKESELVEMFESTGFSILEFKKIEVKKMNSFFGVYVLRK